ncbi:hypothetical protein [Nocardioides sp. SYSU D00038]|uniref:hypothetical protein n=1 Tax=Nocardioides sp. SYSU D00038 TaxID=2812554 RepID=UPI001966E4E8|nr:hypothetical protein [Nocardioides sp. SYSU D00038]
MDDVTWLAFALTLTVAGGLATWHAVRTRGRAAAVRRAGLTALPLAAYLTQTLQLVGEVGSDVADWASGLVLSPSVWVGVLLGAAGAATYVVGRLLERRATPARQEPRGVPLRRRGGRAVPAVGDAELDEIEALLRKRGIR